LSRAENWGERAAVKALFASWLPDGLLSYQKYQFGYILEGLGIENVGIFYDHLIYFTAKLYILCPFGIVCVHVVYFSRLGMFGPRKIWQPWLAFLNWPDLVWLLETSRSLCPLYAFDFLQRTISAHDFFLLYLKLLISLTGKK
jgi:hypothetical protein